MLSDVVDDPLVQRFLTELANTLIETNQSYCICGHSMGCVLALNLGLLIHTSNPVYFNKKIVVIGSAPYKWIPPRLSFKNMENVIVFVYCEQKNFPTERDIVIDCFYLKGDARYEHYLPYHVMYDEMNYDESYKKTIVGIYTEKYDEPYNPAKIEQQFKGPTKVWKSMITLEDGCQERHSWENYYKALNRLFPPLSGGTRRKRIKRQKSRR